MTMLVSRHFPCDRRILFVPPVRASSRRWVKRGMFLAVDVHVEPGLSIAQAQLQQLLDAAGEAIRDANEAFAEPGYIEWVDIERVRIIVDKPGPRFRIVLCKPEPSLTVEIAGKNAGHNLHGDLP
jgi:hypothetical protein